MKTMTCKQLGGACDLKFSANSFDEMAEKSRKHGQEMAAIQDEAHLGAMREMGKIMQDPSGLQNWMADRKKDFDNQPDISIE